MKIASKFSSKAQIISAAFEASQDHIIITDENANILYANKAVEENTGFSLSEVIGKNPSVLWGGHMPEEFYQRMWHIIKVDKKSFVDEIHNKTKGGANVIVNAAGYSPKIQGKVRGF